MFPPAWRAVSKATKEVRSLLAVEDEHTKQIHASLVIMKSAALLSSDSPIAQSHHSLSSNSTFLNKSSKKSLPGVPKTRGAGRGVESPHLQHSLRQLHTSIEDWSGVHRPQGSDYELHSNPRLMPPRETLFDKLYQSNRPAELDEIYFDMSDTLMDRTEDSTACNSILINQEATVVRQASPSGNHSNGTSSLIPTTRDLQLTNKVSPHQYLTLSSHPHTIPAVHRPRLILCGCGGLGQSSHLAPALLHSLEELPVKTLDLAALFGTSTKTPEEACAQVGR